MKPLSMFLAGVIISVATTDIFAQDFQARFLVHPQVNIVGKLGICGWLILPDVADDKGEGLRHLQVAGLLYRDRGRWVEMMYGFVDYQTKPSERLFNIRISERGLKPLSIFMDLHFYKNRRLIGFFVDCPVVGKLRAGLESENWFLDGKPDRLGIGPRVSYTFSKLPLCKTLALTLAYQARFAKEEKSFVRTYLLVNL